VVRPAPGRVVIGEDGMVELDLSETGEVTMPELVDSIAETAEPLIIPEDGMLEMTLDEPIVCPENMQQNAAKEGVVVTVEEHKAKLVDVNAITQEAYDPMKDLVNYRKPPVSLLEDYVSDTEVTDEEIYENKSRIEETLKNFGIAIQRIKATVGPTVTLYEIVQAQGVKISKIQGLENDIAQSLKALGIRIIAPIPGRGTIGIEVPNRDKQVVSMHSSIRSMKFQESKAELPVVIGRTIQNVNYVFDLTKMPHLLVAGATGQGKSVGLNAIITSLLYTKHPSQLKFVMIDPKMVEFSLYAKIEKHFLAKMESEDEAIITDPKKAVYALHSLCIEMDNRLELCKKAGVRNIAEYNEKFISRHLNPQHGHRFLPYIVVVVDEFSDLIMTAREVESPVMRLAQKARAIGIHLIIATQRPDVKVITGGIKANFPARIAFRVMQMIDSRTIIDQPGANQLIGRGDMLFSKDGELTRIQCALVETKEVERVVDYISKQQGYTEAYKLPDYTPESSNEQQLGSESGAPLKYDALFAEIARTAVAGGNLSTSMIQRNYEVGFNRAGRIMMQLERAGIVGRQEGAKPRDILYHDSLSLEAKLQDLGVF
ncbi:MAG: DNA translocase FtsK, partial [Alistipes sp.]